MGRRVRGRSIPGPVSVAGETMGYEVAPEAGTSATGARAVSRLFLASFLASCVLFWWLLSFLYRGVLGVEDPVTDRTLAMSALSAGLFVAGFSLARFRAAGSTISPATLDGCERLSYRVTVLLFPPAIILALIFAASAAGQIYGWVHVSFADQIIYYLHLFFGFMFLGVARAGQKSRKRIALAVVLIALPRFVVSMHYGRMFLAEGVVPLVFIAVARGFLQLSWKRVVQIAGLGLFIIFVPSITRGDPIFGAAGEDAANAGTPAIVTWFAGGSTLFVTQQYLDMDLSKRCPPLLISLTGKVIPYALLHVCTVTLSGVWTDTNVNTEWAANIDRLVTYDLNGSDGSMDEGGTGTSYVLELYLTAGLTGVLLGSFLFGAACKFFTTSMAARSLFSGIWAECLLRAIFSPRGNLGYVFEKVPVLLVATLLVVLISREFRGSSPEPQPSLAS
jgi:hypothetical protein